MNSKTYILINVVVSVMLLIIAIYWLKKFYKKYPKKAKASAVIALLYLVQKQHDNWIPLSAIRYVADFLEIPYMQAYEVATFYSMFNLNPIGKNFIQICRTTPCWLRGSDKLKKIAKKITGCELRSTSDDNMFTVVEVECLGACCNAPVIQINDYYYEDLNEENFSKILNDLKEKKPIKKGSQINRAGSEPKKK